MSIQPNAPYRDRIEDDGGTLIYEGHDAPRRNGEPDPKQVDQPGTSLSGALTQNGRFEQAAATYKERARSPRFVRVYEKLRPGIWSYNGSFHLVDSWREHDGARNVFKFKLRAAIDPDGAELVAEGDFEHRRLIPTRVKLEVWQRDRGKCVKCGARDALHFDHVLAFARGGASVTAHNVQLLCARHNLSKGSKLE